MKLFDDIKPDFSTGFSVALVALPMIAITLGVETTSSHKLLA